MVLEKQWHDDLITDEMAAFFTKYFIYIIILTCETAVWWDKSAFCQVAKKFRKANGIKVKK